MNDHALAPASDDRLRSQWTAGSRPLTILASLAVTGLALAVIHAWLTPQGYQRFMLAYLVAFAFVLSLSLGGLFFVCIQHLTRAGWSVLVRRFAEVLAANFPIVAVLFVPIAVSVLLGDGAIYPWAHTDSPKAQAHAKSPGHASAEASKPADGLAPVAVADPAAPKSPKASPTPHAVKEHQRPGRPDLTPALFVGRWLVYLTAWSYLGLRFWKGSVGQDTSRDAAATTAMESLAGPALFVLGLTLTVGAFDLLMSLDPHWSSTIFGVYYFSGAVVGALAAIILMVLTLQRAGMLTSAIGESHYLDLGRLLFAFVFFWAYIAFSQYMLLWYANMPHTASWLRMRGLTTVSRDVSGWSIVALALLLGHFLLPFAGLMSRHVKRRPVLLGLSAAWLLVMHFLDLAWVVLPQLGPDVRLGVIEWGLGVALLCIYLLGVLGLMRRHSLVPLGDPRVRASSIYESAY